MSSLRLALLLVCSATVGAFAQTNPAPAPNLPPGVTAEQYKWAQMDKYADADAKLPPPAAGEKRVVFFGDSITESWKGQDFFPGKNYVNRGISGQTTTQMLVRFPRDVVDLKPKVVLILAGTNDIAQNQGPISLDDIAGNLEKMAATAKAAGIKPILCSILPAADYGWRKGLQPAGKIVTVNKMVQAWCKIHHVRYLNYYPQLANPQGGMRPELSPDGVHPNSAGFAIMSGMAQKAIDQALGQ